jgi:hypothetical protein
MEEGGLAEFRFSASLSRRYQGRLIGISCGDVRMLGILVFRIYRRHEGVRGRFDLDGGGGDELSDEVIEVLPLSLPQCRRLIIFFLRIILLGLDARDRPVKHVLCTGGQDYPLIPPT